MSASEAARPSTGGASPTNHSPAASPTHAAAAAAAARQSSPNTSAAPPRTAGNRSREGGRGGTLQAQATSSSSASGLQATARRSLQSRAAQNQDDDDDSLQAPLPTTKASPLDFVEWGPPPDMNQRELIFDSLNKIVTAQTQKGGASTGGGGGGGGYGKGAQAGKGDSRGTYIFTWGAGRLPRRRRSRRDTRERTCLRRHRSSAPVARAVCAHVLLLCGGFSRSLPPLPSQATTASWVASSCAARRSTRPSR